MKQFMIILFVLLPLCLFSQVNDTFDGPALDPEWIGKDRDLFIINEEGRLQLNIDPTDAGSASIGRAIAYSADMQWEFDVYMRQEPSDRNKLCVYLYQENADRYYYVRIGSTGTKELGLRRHGNAELVSPQSGFNGYPLLLHVRVTLEDNRYWSLYYRMPGMDGYRLEGQAVYAVEEPPERGFLEFAFHYTANRSDLFSIDNVFVSDRISDTPLESDDPGILPELAGIELLSLSNLRFDFDKPVDKEDAVFRISEIGDASQTLYVGDTKTEVSAFFDSEMQLDHPYIISYSGLKSLSGQDMPDYSEECIVRGEEEDGESSVPGTSAYSYGDVLLNEVMAKPGDGGMTEYVELYNVSSRSVSLKGWEFRNVNGKKTKVLPEVTLLAGGYAVLWDDRESLTLPHGTLAIPITRFPALNDNGATLQLRDAAGNLIDEVSYGKATAARSWERSSAGWHLSTDPRGGTPGAANSSPDGESAPEPDDPDEPDDPKDPVTGDDVLPGEIVFNELLPEPYAGGSEYIELYNRSERPLSVTSLSLSVRKPDGTIGTRYPLASVTRRLDAGGYLLLTKKIDAVTPFYTIEDEEALCELSKLPVLANTASTLVLFRTEDGAVIDEVAYSAKWHAPLLRNTKGVSIERIDPEKETQSSANWTSAAAVAGYGTPGYRNSQHASDEPTGIEPPVRLEETGDYTVTYRLDRPGYNCRAFVFNIAGQRVAEIADHRLLGTTGQLTWDGNGSNGSSLPAGVYIFYAEIYHPDGAAERFKKVFLVR